MSSESTAISVNSISKRYELYDSPRQRLKQIIIPPVQRLIRANQSRYFNEYWALHEVSFDVQKGESVGIIGRNGSGKSTLLQIIAGTLDATSGDVSTSGRIAGLLELGSGFNPEFTGRENVFLNGALLGLKQEKIENVFDEIASFADIGEYIDQPVKTYSSGMMLRLAFAVQVQVSPDILIIDEALAVGDALFQKRCFQKIESLISNGTTLLFVSHDQESIRTLTNRSLLLNKGKALSWGPSSEVVLEYRRLLHDDESKYFQDITNKIASKRREQNTCAQNIPPPVTGDIEKPAGSEPTKSTSRSSQLSFGQGDVQVMNVETLDANRQPCNVFHPGQTLKIRITCQSFIDTTKLNIGLRIRNKEGVKIYSWGTLNQDMEYSAKNLQTPKFWNRLITADEIFDVTFDCKCPLGTNLYEIQAAVTYEETPDYMGQRMLHWMDEAAFFQVIVKRDEHFFGGVADLGMIATW